jgi:hypothetical protein
MSSIELMARPVIDYTTSDHSIPFSNSRSSSPLSHSSYFTLRDALGAFICGAWKSKQHDKYLVASPEWEAEKKMMILHEKRSSDPDFE